jgi:hypothetical protein
VLMAVRCGLWKLFIGRLENDGDRLRLLGHRLPILPAEEVIEFTTPSVGDSISNSAVASPALNYFPRKPTLSVFARFDRLYPTSNKTLTKL